MSKDQEPSKAGGYARRELEQPVQKVVDDTLNDPSFATKIGERDATEVLKEGVAKSLKAQHSTNGSIGGSAGPRTQEAGNNLKSAIGKSLIYQPLATLAVFGAFTFLLGALWK